MTRSYRLALCLVLAALAGFAPRALAQPKPEPLDDYAAFGLGRIALLDLRMQADPTEDDYRIAMLAFDLARTYAPDEPILLRRQIEAAWSAGMDARAQVPSPKDPSERPAPPQPVVKTPVQRSGGTIRVAFTVTAGGGAQYLVQRMDTRLDTTETDWFPVATVTEKFYDDQAVPFGLRKVQYRVSAQISSGPASEWSEPATFSFGTQGSQAGPMAAKAGSIEPVRGEDMEGAG